MISKHHLGRLVLWLAVLLLFSGLAAQDDSAPAQEMVVLSEVMYDPTGSEFYDEFVEIFNLSFDRTINLAGWLIGDNASLDEIVDAGNGLDLAPRSYALIVDQGYSLNSNSYDSLIPDEALVVTIDGASFGQNGWTNSASKTVVLVRPDGTIADSHKYSPGYISGHSDERIDLEVNDEEGNWEESLAPLGTPGFANSVRILDRDLSIERADFTPNPIPAGRDGRIVLTLRNMGRETVEEFEILLYADSNEDSVAQDTELLYAQPVSNALLTSGDSTNITLPVPLLPPGAHNLFLLTKTEGDENPKNNIIEKLVWIGYPPSSVILNEIMYRPISDGPEWIELINLYNERVLIQNWHIAEVRSEKIYSLTSDRVFIGPGEYLVISADSTLDLDGNASLLVPVSFPSLNNNGEEIHLLDFANQRMDGIYYRDEWGGGSGISLERINPASGVQDSTNWASSAAPSGSTPGRQNSLYTEVVPSEASLSISPNPFSPNGDGHEDFTILQLNLPVPTATISVRVYDVLGREVADILNNVPSGSQRQIVWNGKTRSGGSLRTGIYIVFVQALNQQRGVLEELKQPVVVVGGHQPK